MNSSPDLGIGMPTPTPTDTFDLGNKLTQRLQDHIADRVRTQHRIDLATTQLQNLFKSAPKRPRDSKIALREKVRKLERDRTSRSLPLSQEKALIRQIDGVQKQIRMHDDVERHQELIRRKKAEIESAKDALRTTNASISEIEEALSKVELAKRLGCSVSDLINREVDCPVEKLGRVIGKHGATIKAIEEKVGVHIDVDKIHGKIHVRGNESAAEEAVKELENLTLAVDEEIEVSAELITYLLSQHSDILSKIKDDNPDVFINVLAKITRIHMRGHPAKVSKAKGDFLSVQVVSKTRTLTGREVAIVVGKTGSTINSISDKHSVVMEVSRDHSEDDSSTLRIIGQSANVDSAIAEVDTLLHQNEDVEEMLLVDPMMKNQLLNNSGTGIKEFQNSLNNAVLDSGSEAASGVAGGGGVFLVFDRNTPKGDPPALVIKTIRANMERAKNLVSKKIDEFNSNITTIEVPAEVIPAIIGKGGAKINSFRSEGTGAEVEADTTTGKVKIYSHDAATRETIKSAVEQIVAENHIGHVSIEKATIGLVLGEPGKEVREKVAEIGCNFNVSDDDSKLVLKGTDEQIAQASELLKAFIAVNHIAEVDIEPEDEPILFSGGSNSILNKVESDHGVKANFRKGKNVVQVRGELEKINVASAEIERFLKGGDGMEVCKFNVPDGAIGSVIGKGGSNISKLEEDFEGVRVNVGRDSNVISIRGPEDLVNQCRIRLVTTIATARVSDTIELTPTQKGDLSSSDIIKRVAGITSTSIALNEDSIVMRGISNDVRDAKSLLNEHLVGVYRGYLDLEASQCKRVKNTLAKDSSHFERIKLSTGADIALEASESCIVVTGKRASVKKAKVALMGFLDFMFPQQFQTVKVHKTLFKSMGDPAPLADISVKTGASVSLDRDMTWVLVRSEDSDATTKAVTLVEERLTECEKLNAVFRFETFESWILPIIIGKGGSQIQQLQSENECSIDIYKDEVTVVISADSEEKVQAAKVALEAIVEQARKECIFIEIPESAIPAFVGKGGSHIKQMSEETDVEIERVKKHSNLFKVTGKEDAVTEAKTAILSWLKTWEANHTGLTIEVEERFIPSVLGKGGEIIRSIQKESGCKIDIDRNHLTITVREGDEANRESAMEKIKSIIDEEKAKAAERAAVKAKLREQEQAEIAAAKAQKAAEAAAASNPEPVAKEVPASDTGVKDRSKEFTSRPVGLTVNKPKAKGGLNAALEVGTKEGRELYLMLISGNESNSEQDDRWESSTVSSSAAMISACGSNDGETVLHYRSISGFTVRL